MSLLTGFVLLLIKNNWISWDLLFLASKTDQIDENLKQALQKDLNVMAPGLTIQVSSGISWDILGSFLELPVECFLVVGYAVT